MAVTINSIGTGIGKLPLGNDIPLLQISDNYFIFDLTTPIEKKLEEFFSELDFLGNVTILHLEHHGDIGDFKNALTSFINYAIFKNKNLCEKLTMSLTSKDYLDATNTIWPKEAKPITKLNGRVWPNNGFAKLFDPIKGSGSVAIAREKMDLSDIVSWFFEFDHYQNTDIVEKYNITDLYGDSENRHQITVSDLPYKPTDFVWKNSRTSPKVTFPEVHNDSYEYTYRYSVIYYFYSETVSLPLQEMHSRPVNNFTSSQTIDQNTIKIHMKTLHKVEVVCDSVTIDPETGEMGEFDDTGYGTSGGTPTGPGTGSGEGSSSGGGSGSGGGTGSGGTGSGGGSSIYTTDEVLPDSKDALTSGGAYRNLVRRLSIGGATGDENQGVYIDANGQVQPTKSVVSEIDTTKTNPVNSSAVVKYIDKHQASEEEIIAIFNKAK